MDSSRMNSSRMRHTSSHAPRRNGSPNAPRMVLPRASKSHRREAGPTDVHTVRLTRVRVRVAQPVRGRDAGLVCGNRRILLIASMLVCGRQLSGVVDDHPPRGSHAAPGREPGGCVYGGVRGRVPSSS